MIQEIFFLAPDWTPQFLNLTSNTENSAFKIGDVWLSQH